MNLDQKVAVVVGGGSGIGAAIGRKLACHGAQVVVADLSGPSAQRVAAAIRDGGGQAIEATVDVAEEAAVEQMIAAAAGSLGRIDVLVNSAAATAAEHLLRDVNVAEMDAEVWDHTLRINVRGAMLTSKYAIPVMIENGGGSIVNIASAAGLQGDAMRPAYGSSKAGLIGATRYVAAAYGKQGIRCNAVAPGAILTDAMKASLPEPALEILLRHHLTPFLGEPDDVAEAVAFLASDASRFITGHTLCVDGGFTTHSPCYAEFNALHGEERGA